MYLTKRNDSVELKMLFVNEDTQQLLQNKSIQLYINGTFTLQTTTNSQGLVLVKDQVKLQIG